MKHGPNFIDRTGQVFGRLKVLKYAGKANDHSKWLCICRCGKKSIVGGSHLVRGSTRSCGCLQRELKAKRCNTFFTTHGHARTGHRSPEYAAWHNMLQRCTNPKSQRWNNYGGNNPPVRVCKRWRKFVNFLADMGPRPKGTSLSRLGDIGNYCPSNTAWHSLAQQQAEHRKKAHAQ